MPKRKSTDGIDNVKEHKTSKTAKTSSSTSASTSTAKTADKLNLTYNDFKKQAPALHISISKLDSTKKASSSSASDTLLSADLDKKEMSTGSYGYSSSGKKVTLEIQVDGKLQKVQAIVSVNITVVGSKKVGEKTDA